MTIQCGDRALADYRKKQEGVTAVSVALSAPPEKVGDAVFHMKEQMDQIRMKLNQMQASYLAGKLEEIKADDKFVRLFEENWTTLLCGILSMMPVNAVRESALHS